MLLKDLFKRDNVDYPYWLDDDHYIHDEWEEAICFKSDSMVKWELTTIRGLDIISIEKGVFTFSSYNIDNELIFEKVETPEYKTIT